MCQPEGHQHEENDKGLLVPSCLLLHCFPWCRPLCSELQLDQPEDLEGSGQGKRGWALARAAWRCCPGRTTGAGVWLSLPQSVAPVQHGGDGISSLGLLWASNTNTRKAAGFIELFLGAGL